ncbi:Gaa1-like protein [Mycena amicta]|nr:Gaa1-like protein [Mycena amicta]
MNRLIAQVRAFRRPQGDPNLNRLQRRRALVSGLTRRVHLIKCAFFLAGYFWMLALPSQRLGRGTYIDENALQPGQVNTYWNWGDVANADRYLQQLERLRDANATSQLRANTLVAEFMKLGIPASTQKYRFFSSIGTIEGTNAYAILSSPRTSGTEAMVISASWVSRIGDGTLNLRGVSTVLALANFLKRYSLWAKDIIFIISDSHMDGMQAWLSAYHGATQSNLEVEALELTSGVIWTALNIDYPGHSFSHLGIFHEGINGRLPNQDLMNSFQFISKWTGGVPVLVYDHVEKAQFEIPSWIPKSYHDEIRTYEYQSRNVVRHIGYQARGRGSGVHGLFHQFRIDAFTMFALPATGPHGFHAIGRIMESTLRTTNNLLERLHASIFFYILTAPERFLKIGSFLPSAVLISVAMMFGGLKVWSDAAWILNTSEKEAPSLWVQRRRPVIPILLIMLSTHILGFLIFILLSTSSFLHGTLLHRPDPQTTAPMSALLKALNLCFASTVISITTVVNFSLAMTLAILLGIPLSVSSASSILPLRIASALWDWQVLGVWFAPFVCIVYTPLVLQAAIVCLLPAE